MIENVAGMTPGQAAGRHRAPVIPGPALTPFEAMDRTHPDHDWWVNGRGWCFDPGCTAHAYGRPSERLLLGKTHATGDKWAQGLGAVLAILVFCLLADFAAVGVVAWLF